MEPLRIRPEFYGYPVIVAGSGPSLTGEVTNKVRFARWLEGWKVLTVNDAYKLMPWADALYAADLSWWQAHKCAPKFDGKRYTCTTRDAAYCDDKTREPELPQVTLIGAHDGKDFSSDPEFIHYGEPPHSGFQAVNLALLMGARAIVLVGFDYQFTGGKSHYFGDHPPAVRQYPENAYLDMAKAFDAVTTTVPIINATPGSRLSAFPRMTLNEAVDRHGHVHRYGS